MTKYYEFQKDLLKALIKGSIDSKRRMFYKIDNDGVYCCPDGSYLIKIPSLLWMLDSKKIFEGWKECDTERVIYEDKQLPAYYTKSVITKNVKLKIKLKMHRFVVNGQDVYVNEKVLKYFDLENSTFKGTDSNSPIYIYELGSFVGLVLPLHFIEKEKEK